MRTDGARNLEAVLERLYRRWGPRRYVAFYSALSMSSAVAVGVLIAFALGRYIDMSASELAITLAVVAGVLAIAYPWALGTTRRYWGPVLFWIERPREADEARVWRAAIDLPRGVVFAIAARVSLLAVPGTALVARVLDVGVTDALMLLAGVLALISYAIVLNLFLAELMIRPILAAVADRLPPSVTAGYQGVSVGRKLYAAVPFLVFASALLALAFSRRVGAGLDAVGRDLASAAVIAATLGLLATVPMVESVRGPVRRLLLATRALRSGEFDVRVPVTSTDELGALMQSFNEMVEDLRRQAEELRASRARIVAAADDERRRMERDLHDGAQQQLVLVGLKLAAAQRMIERDPAAGAQMFDELRRDLNTALEELRDLAHGLYPAVLENEGLPAALEQAAARSAIPTTVACDGAGRYPAALEAAVYFCCLEALQNAGKHAGAGAHAKIVLAQRGNRLAFEVADDGAGFEDPAITGSAGIQNMTDRIGALGGELRVQSARGRGTTVTGSVPVGDPR